MFMNNNRNKNTQILFSSFTICYHHDYSKNPKLKVLKLNPNSPAINPTDDHEPRSDREPKTPYLRCSRSQLETSVRSSSRQRPSQLETQPVRDPIPFATQLDSQNVRDPSQRQSVRDWQQPVRDSTISARDLSNDQFQRVTRSVPARDDQQAIRSRLFFIRWSIQPDLRLR